MRKKTFDNRYGQYLVEIMESLDHEMRMVAIEMMSTGYFPFMTGGGELIDMAVKIRGWAEAFKKANGL